MLPPVNPLNTTTKNHKSPIFHYNTGDKKEINIMKTIFSAYGLIALLALMAIGVGVYYAYGTFTNIDDIKNRFAELYAWGNAQNQLATAGISLWLLGVVTYIARDVPRKVWIFIVKQSTVTLTLNNCDEVFSHFLTWYHKTGRSAKSRTLVAQDAWDSNRDNYGTQISSGYGMHFFVFDGKIFSFSRNEKEASQTQRTKESITIKTIGRSQVQFLELMEVIRPDAHNNDVTDIYKYNASEEYWGRTGEQASRKFDSVILPQKTKDEITDHLDTFLAERDWYIDNGIPYRTGIILHGVPGTGKTSLVRGLCERLGKALYVFSLTALTIEKLEQAFSELPRGSVCLIEDIDTYRETASRKDGGGFEGLGILLNAIDGIVASDGRILIATTNNLDALDPALVRKGRFNLTINISYLTEECFRKFFLNFYPNFPILPNTKFKEDMSPAELQALIIDNRDNGAYVLSQCVDSIH